VYNEDETETEWRWEIAGLSRFETLRLIKCLDRLSDSYTANIAPSVQCGGFARNCEQITTD